MNLCDNQIVERIHCGDPGLGVGGFEPYSLVAIIRIVPGSPSLGQLPHHTGLLRLARFRALADRRRRKLALQAANRPSPARNRLPGEE